MFFLGAEPEPGNRVWQMFFTFQNDHMSRDLLLGKKENLDPDIYSQSVSKIVLRVVVRVMELLVFFPAIRLSASLYSRCSRFTSMITCHVIFRVSRQSSRRQKS